MYLAATMAGWNSIQGNSIQGRTPHSYPLSSLCKNYEKTMFDFLLALNSNKILLSLCSFFMFGKKKMGGDVDRKKKKDLKSGKNKYCIILLSSVPSTCLQAWMCVYIDTIYSFHIYIHLYHCYMFNEHCQNLAFDSELYVG